MLPSTVSPSWVNAAVRKVRLKLQAASTASLSDRQAASIKAVQAAVSPTIISQVLYPAPREDDLRAVLFHVIRRLGSGHERIEWPETVDVEAEWTGFERTGAPQSRIPPSSERAKYERILRSVSHQVTILYVHGGAF